MGQSPLSTEREIQYLRLHNSIVFLTWTLSWILTELKLEWVASFVYLFLKLYPV